MELFNEYSEKLPQTLVEIEQLQNELKQVNDTLQEIKANKKCIEAQIAKKLDLCVKLNNQNTQKNATAATCSQNCRKQKSLNQ